MRLGFHVSIAGGFSQVPQRARARGCETVQIFSRSPRMWRATPIKREESEVFRRGMIEFGMSPIVVHTPYLLNLGSAAPALGRKSHKVLAEELARAADLGADYVVTHVGGGAPEEAATAVAKRIARRVDAALGERSNPVILLLENSAGAGNLVGRRFEELADIISHSAHRDLLGVCLDTAHCHAAGYEVTDAEGLDRTVHALATTIGLERLKVIHGNDSKSPFGSRVDRHWHIGKGTIGLAGFRAVLHHPQLSELPLIMETPQDSDEDDRRNMRTMKRLRSSRKSPRV